MLRSRFIGFAWQLFDLALFFVAAVTMTVEVMRM